VGRIRLVRVRVRYVKRRVCYDAASVRIRLVIALDDRRRDVWIDRTVVIRLVRTVLAIIVPRLHVIRLGILVTPITAFEIRLCFTGFIAGMHLLAADLSRRDPPATEPWNVYVTLLVPPTAITVSLIVVISATTVSRLIHRFRLRNIDRLTKDLPLLLRL